MQAGTYKMAVLQYSTLCSSCFGTMVGFGLGAGHCNFQFNDAFQSHKH